METIKVDTNVVACDGGGGGLGHPRVYLHIRHTSYDHGDEEKSDGSKPEGQVECPYCGRIYVLIRK